MTADDVKSKVADHDLAPLVDGNVARPGGDSRLAIPLSSDVVALPEGSLELTIRNDAEEDFGFNDYDWQLYRHDGSNWRFLTPLRTPLSSLTLHSGGTLDYRISVDNAAVPDPFLKSDVPLDLAGLGPGVYAFVNDSGSFGGEEQPLAFGSTFGFAGEGPAVRPTATEATVEREDGTLTIWGDFEGNQPRAFEVSFVNAAETTLIAEQVRLNPGLQNAIPYAATEGVQTIRYVAGEPVVETAVNHLDATAPDASSYRFRDYRFEVAETDP